MKKSELCDRCFRPITDKSGAGALIIYTIQPQPGIKMPEERTQSLHVCGYCLHDLVGWLYPEIDKEGKQA